MSRARAAADLALAALAGAGCGVLLHALAWPVAPGPIFLDVKLVLASAGDLPIGILAAGLAGLAAALRSRRASSGPVAAAAALRAAAFWTALFVGLGVLAGAWLFHLLQWHTGVRYGVLAAVALGALPRLPAPPRVASRALGGATLAGLALLYLGVGFSERIGGARIEVPEGLHPLPPAPADMRLGSGPDVLLISVDTLRADDFLAEEVPTPHLDALRARGRWAEYARAPAPSTLPSHVTMVTGRHPLETGCYTNSGFMLADAGDTLSEVFRDAGWRALGVASNGVLDAHTGFTRGFEAFSNLESYESPARDSMTSLVLSTRRMSGFRLLLDDPECVAVGVRLARLRTNVPKDIHAVYTAVPAATVGDAAIAYLDQLYAQERPGFFFIHFIDPHLPYAPPAEVAGALSAASALPARYAEYPRLTTFLANAVQADLRSGDSPAREDALRAVRHLRLVYREELMAVDAQIGRLMAHVERGGRPTVVLFTSDHGEHFGEFDQMSHGETLYEEMLRVPFVLAGPGVAPGRFAAPPRLEDVGLTLLHAAGIPARGFGRGRDLLQPDSGPHSPLVAAHQDLLAVLDAEWKAIYSWDFSEPRSAPLDLLRLCDPRDESVARSDAAAEARLRTLAEEARSTARVRSQRTLTEDERNRLASLGYAFDAEGKLIER